MSMGEVTGSPPTPPACGRGVALRRLGGQLLGLGDGFLDAADHIEGGFGEVVVFAVDDCLERFDRVLDGHELAGDAGEHLGDVEGLRSEEHTSELQSLMRISY